MICGYMFHFEWSLTTEDEVITWERCKELHQLVTEATEYMTSPMIRLNLQEELTLRFMLSSAVHYYDDRLFSGKETILLSSFSLYDPLVTVREILKQLKRQVLRQKLLEALCAKKEVEHEEGASNSLLLDTEIWDLVLLESGDVERNPGPLTRSQLEAVVDDILHEDISFQVFTSVCSLRANWHELCLALGLPPSLLSIIRKEQAGDTKACLREGLINWLQRNYNIELHGLPTWRKLVEAVDHPAGGENHALALKIAEEHKKSDVLPIKEGYITSGVSNQASPCSDPKKGQTMCTAFANMYRAVSRLLGRNVDIDELKDFLWCFCHPLAPQQRCVDPRVYEGATSTKDILKNLCPEYVNPVKLFVLEGIVETFGSRQCKRLLKDYTDKL